MGNWFSRWENRANSFINNAYGFWHMLLLCHHIWYNIFCLFIFHFKLPWDHVKLSVIFHSGVHLSVTKSSYSLDYETDDLSKLRITISSGAWRILKENIAKLINFYMLSANQESFFAHPKFWLTKLRLLMFHFQLMNIFVKASVGGMWVAVYKMIFKSIIEWIWMKYEKWK